MVETGSCANSQRKNKLIKALRLKSQYPHTHGIRVT